MEEVDVAVVLRRTTVLMEGQRWRDVIDQLRPALVARPDNGRLWQRYAQAQAHDPDLAQESVRNAEKALRLLGSDAEALRTLGLAQLAAGQPRGALDALGEAVRLDPHNDEAQELLAAALDRLGFSQPSGIRVMSDEDVTGAVADVEAVLQPVRDVEVSISHWARKTSRVVHFALFGLIVILLALEANGVVAVAALAVAGFAIILTGALIGMNRLNPDQVKAVRAQIRDNPWRLLRDCLSVLLSWLLPVLLLPLVLVLLQAAFY